MNLDKRGVGPPANVLVPPVGQSDHHRGDLGSPVILVEYGDYECPHSAAAYSIVSQLLTAFAGIFCFVFRHFPLLALHPDAEFAAISAEAAGAQGSFWPMHDMLFENQRRLHSDDILRYAAFLGLDREAFIDEADRLTCRARIHDHLRSGVESGVNGTPTFFLNGRRYDGALDIENLARAIRSASGISSPEAL